MVPKILEIDRFVPHHVSLPSPYYMASLSTWNCIAPALNKMQSFCFCSLLYNFTPPPLFSLTKHSPLLNTAQFLDDDTPETRRPPDNDRPNHAFQGGPTFHSNSVCIHPPITRFPPFLIYKTQDPFPSLDHTTKAWSWNDRWTNCHQNDDCFTLLWKGKTPFLFYKTRDTFPSHNQWKTSYTCLIMEQPRGSYTISSHFRATASSHANPFPLRQILGYWKQ